MNRLVRPFAYAIERRARKDYICDYCSKSINSKNTYFEKIEMTSDHNFKRMRYCSECYDTKNI